MSELTFEFRIDQSITATFDPADFEGLDEFEIREALYENLPDGVDDGDVEYAARRIDEWLVAEVPVGR